MKQFLAFLCFFCIVILGSGQDLPRVSPPTPEVAAMGKFIDIPISFHTGTPNISIPLVSLSVSNISVPVSINYHASGIKVSEIASRVGIGWSLTGGGMITRSVRGIPDDENEGFLNTDNTVSAYIDMTPQQQTLAFDAAVRGRTQDYESDLYYFNFPGGSGKFFFDQQGVIYSHPKNDLRIKTITGFVNNINTIIGWEINTPDGTVYTFGIIPGSSDKVTELKRNQIYAENSQLPSSYTFHTSGWYLTQIKDYKGNIVHFNYTEGTTDVVYYNLLNQNKYLQSVVPGTNTNCTIPGVSASLSEDHYKPIYLTSIETTQGSVHFSYDTSREDLKNDKALTAVMLKDAHNTIIDSYYFEHGYFTTAPWQRLGTYGDLDQRTKKLYLKKIKQQKENLINREHSFSYYQDHAFPERLSFNKDFWDYANGSDNNELYPEIVYRNWFGTPVHVDGGDRTINADVAQTLLLKEIVYPTKGSTEFLYESNTVSGSKAFFAGNKLITRSICGQVGTPTDSREIISATFTLDKRTLVYYKSEIAEACESNPTGEECPDLWLTDASGATVRTFFGSSPSNAQPFELEAGSYSLNAQNGLIPTSVDSNGVPRYDNYGNVELFEKVLIEENGSTTPIAKTGGLRIKEMRFKDANGMLINTKKYNYRRFEHPDLSSGFASNPPSFLYLRAPFLLGYDSCTFNIIQSNSLFPQNGLSSYHVGYSNVTEFNTDDLQGKTEYTYRFIADEHRYSENNEFISGEGYPFAPAKDYSHQRGLLLGKKIFKYHPTTQKFSIVEELSNTYKRKGEFLSYNIAMGYIGNASPEHTFYNNFSERYLKTATTKSSYHLSGNVKTITQYTFDEGYQGRTFPKTISNTNSKDHTVTTKNYYPDDVILINSLGAPLTNDEIMAINTLKTQHRIKESIQQETLLNGKLLTTQRTNYNKFSALPANIEQSKGNGELIEAVVYHEYDDTGNPTEVSKADGTHVVYIWGYEQQYPIAKIENITYADISQYVTNLQTLSDDDNDRTTKHLGAEGTLRSDLDAMRETLKTSHPAASVSTYTYDPLIGVTSMTNPSGRTLYYQYDDFNRLQFVRDQEERLLSENKYNFKN